MDGEETRDDMLFDGDDLLFRVDVKEVGRVAETATQPETTTLKLALMPTGNTKNPYDFDLQFMTEQGFVINFAVEDVGMQSQG